ncbi:aminopeptidase P family protein [Candidatus Bipolaricaulota bacterium]|nr:aminopeptidase P family protein [Candidatus Bipolaricaulota bacterium]TFH08085.1 MAG: aminopeptidase P family protein [Candidatus Atribacteria bacterium]
MTDYALRRQRLLETITTEAFIATNWEGSDPVTLRYLSGFTGEGSLIISRDHAILLTDSRYTEQASQETSGLDIQEGRGWNGQDLVDGLTQHSLTQATFSSIRASVYWLKELEKLGNLKFVAEKDPVSQLRRVKSPEELDHLRAAAKVADAALAELVPWIKVGMSEAEIALQLEMLIRSADAEGSAFGINVSAGANTALNHYNPFHHAVSLKPGDLLLLDFGANVKGYRSDITRTFVVGKPSARDREIYDIVLKANCRAIDAVRAGITGIAADAVARDLIKEAGFGDNFGHGLGHGIGLEVHEAPSLSPLSKDTLEPGMVVTIEPGIYFTGIGGVRIEDDAIVTETGCEIITAFPKEELISVG